MAAQHYGAQWYRHRLACYPIGSSRLPIRAGKSLTVTRRPSGKWLARLITEWTLDAAFGPPHLLLDHDKTENLMQLRFKIGKSVGVRGSAIANYLADRYHDTGETGKEREPTFHQANHSPHHRTHPLCVYARWDRATGRAVSPPSPGTLARPPYQNRKTQATKCEIPHTAAPSDFSCWSPTAPGRAVRQGVALQHP